MQKLDVSLLEGWLVKKHSNENKSMFSLSSESKRWFKVREVKGIEETEMTLAYYASHRTKEAKGFIYLRDVTMIYAMDDLSITLKSPARIMTICTETPSEHAFWLEGLVHLCTSAEVSTGPNVVIQYKYRNIEKAEEKGQSPSATVHTDHKSTEKNSFSAHEQRPGTNSDEVEEDSSEMAPSKADREDHRLSGYRSGASNGTTTRLHSHIRKEGDASTISTSSNGNANGNGNAIAIASAIATSNAAAGRSADVLSTTKEVAEAAFESSPPRKSSHEIEIDKDRARNIAPATPNVDDLENVALNSSHRSEYVSKRYEDPSSASEGKDGTEFSFRKVSNTPKMVSAENPVNVSKVLRRACDEGSMTPNVPKSSIDDLLLAPSRTTHGIHYDSDEDKQHDRSLDLDSEKQFYADAKAQREISEREEQKYSGRSRSNSYLEQHLIDNEARRSVPFPPCNSPPQFAQQSLTKVDAVIKDKGQIAVDENFANEDWDSPPAKLSGSTSKAESKEGNARNKKLLEIPSGVRADDNWLDDDFDS